MKDKKADYKCPNCHSVFKQAVPKCPDCGKSLPGAAMPPEKKTGKKKGK